MVEPKRVTMLDVAKQAGVSYQTVSRVINDHPSVAPETRERVLQIIRELNYRPSQAARNLAGYHSKTLAVITYGLGFYGPTQMITNIEMSAREAGYDLIFANVDPGNYRKSIAAAADRILRWSVDGVLVITPVKNGFYEYLLTEFRNIPVIQIDTAPGSATPSVIVDQYHGSHLATQHLIDLGHRRVCEISGPLNWHGAIARHNAWVDTLQRAGLEPGTSRAGDWTARSGYLAAQQLLKIHACTALVVGNDQMALGVINAIHEKGLRVPGDISVVGFDNIPESAFFFPPLTTVHQDFGELGRQGMDYLLQLLYEPSAAAQQRTIKPYLVKRQSTAAPPH